jgi:hypothetical protein
MYDAEVIVAVVVASLADTEHGNGKKERARHSACKAPYVTRERP